MNEESLDNELFTRIIKSGVEGKALDYKRAMNWNVIPKRGKVEIVRDIMAMANSNVPGYIVIGVNDDGGVAGSYIGVNEVQAKSFDQSKIADMIKHYSDPEPSFGLYKTVVEGKKYIVIRVLPFNTVPHICIKQYADIIYEGDVYVRAEGARTTRVEKAQEMRALVDRAIQINGDDIVDRIRRLVCVPEEREPDSATKFEAQLKELIEEIGK